MEEEEEEDLLDEPELNHEGSSACALRSAFLNDQGSRVGGSGAAKRLGDERRKEEMMRKGGRTSVVTSANAPEMKDAMLKVPVL